MRRYTSSSRIRRHILILVVIIVIAATAATTASASAADRFAKYFQHRYSTKRVPKGRSMQIFFLVNSLLVVVDVFILNFFLFLRNRTKQKIICEKKKHKISIPRLFGNTKSLVMSRFFVAIFDITFYNLVLHLFFSHII